MPLPVEMLAHSNTKYCSYYELDPKLLADNFSTRHKKHYYDTICFGSQSIKDAVDLNNFFNANKKPDFNKFYNPEILFLIALFDIWVENDDRSDSGISRSRLYNGRIRVQEPFFLGIFNHRKSNPILDTGSRIRFLLILSKLGVIWKVCSILRGEYSLSSPKCFDIS